jgi:hypothetical protein
MLPNSPPVESVKRIWPSLCGGNPLAAVEPLARTSIPPSAVEDVLFVTTSFAVLAGETVGAVDVPTNRRPEQTTSQSH